MQLPILRRQQMQVQREKKQDGRDQPGGDVVTQRHGEGDGGHRYEQG